MKYSLSERRRPTDAELTLLFAGVVGLLGALSSLLFRELALGAQALLWGTPENLILSAQSIAPWQRLLVPSLGGLAAGLVIRYGLRRGGETTDFMEAVSLGEGVIHVPSSLVKCLSSLVTVASGGSIGREGAMVQLSSMLASWSGGFMPVSRQHRKLLVACGAAAGIASAYNAPIAGALFVAEIVLGSIAMESLGPLAFASIVATITTRVLIGPSPLFEIPPFRLVSALELVPYFATGVLLGALAPWFIRFLRGCERAFAWLRLPVPLRFLLGGLLVGAISLRRPEVWGNGQTPITAILASHWEWRLVLAVLVAKFLATGATVGSGAVGGVFTPTLMVGASLGYLIGLLVHASMPATSAEASAYALVGMGSFLAATTHAPLMAILALFEMTLDYAIVLPLMLACMVAYYTARWLGADSVYSQVLRRKSEALPVSPAGGIRDMIRENPVSVGENAPFAEVVQAFERHRHSFIYVVDRSGRFLGAISLHDIKGHIGDQSLSRLMIASELMHTDFPVVERDCTLGHALERSLAHEWNRLPVIDNERDRHLVGTLSKSDLLLAMSLDHRPGLSPR